MKNNTNIARLIIGFILGSLLLFGSYQLSSTIIESKEKPKSKIEKMVNKIYTQTVENKSIPISIQEKGNLQALRKVELFSEVQGILKSSNKLFKPGQTYGEGSTILTIDDAEFKASLIAQKSNLYNIIAQIMPDLKLDYPDVFSKWEKYLQQFDLNKEVTTLPEFESDKEKFFINSKNIVSSYYNIKNLEERHKKYTIDAPFHSIVTEALVHPGTLIRSGQKLGSIISPNVYELPVSVNESYQEFLSVGKKVSIHNLDNSKNWIGRIARIDGTVNTTTQGIQVYIEVSGQGLKEGMYLEAQLEGRSIPNAYEISRKLLVNNDHIFIIKDQMLHLTPVDVAFYKSKTAIVTNLENGTLLLENPIPGAYDGMLVEIVNH